MRSPFPFPGIIRKASSMPESKLSPFLLIFGEVVEPGPVAYLQDSIAVGLGKWTLYFPYRPPWFSGL